MYENLIISNRGPIQVININRPKALNSLNKKTLRELFDVIKNINDDPSILVCIITGSGDRSFVAGADIYEMKDMTPLEATQFSAFGIKVFNAIEQSSKPFIAAVQGYALGGGLELALACDFIYASKSATFGLVETKLGLIPGFGGLSRLVKRVGLGRARELIFTAQQINGEEAYKIGLVNFLCLEDVLEQSINCAKQITLQAPYAINLSKSLMAQDIYGNSKLAYELTAKAFGLSFASKDSIEGINAFIDKRAAKFEGK